MPFILSEKSLAKLEGVHPDLVKVVKAAISVSEVDFAVLEGVRTLERQRALLAAGATKTINSRHLTGHAVDLGVIVGGRVSWHPNLYHKLADVVLGEAARLGVNLTWGGSWKSFPDLVHFELNRKFYK